MLSRRPALSREFVEEKRRLRYVEAMAEILHEFGRSGLTSANLVRLAGTARNTFYDVFSGVEDCLSYGISVAEEELFEALHSQSGDGDWTTELHDAIGGFFSAVASRPFLAELFLIHSPALQRKAGPASSWGSRDHFVPLLRRGRAAKGVFAPQRPSDVIDECLSHAIIALAARRVRSSEVESLPLEARSMTVLVSRYYPCQMGRLEEFDGLAAAS